jgi:signal recognition particle receptor subunit beta
MVFFNYATMQMAAKIVYYGPGLCGKTTNLHYIYAKTSPQSRGEMVSLETETDRTLFFDLLPIDVGVIGGFKTRLQLYTIPGQVFYNTTRKLVLKGVDGLVFVADSQSPMLQANVESLKNLRDNLAEIGLNLDDIPMILQMNKRDLPSVAPVQTLREMLDPDEKYEYVESSAVSGQGVFETLKLISKLTLRLLRRRMMGDDASRAAAAAARKPVFQVHGEPNAAQRAGNEVNPIQAPVLQPPTAGHTQPVASMSRGMEVQELSLAGVQRGGATAAASKSSPALASDPFDVSEPEIDFSQLDVPDPEPLRRKAEPAKTAKAADPAKHVRLRSTIDIMAELEALRKKATQGISKGKSQPGSPRRPSSGEVAKSINVTAAPGVSDRARAVRVAVVVEDENQNPLQKQEQVIELEDGGETRALNVELKVDFKPGQVN